MQSTVAPENLNSHPIAMTNAQVMSDRTFAVADFADAKRPNLYAAVTKLDPGGRPQVHRPGVPLGVRTWV